MGQKDKKSRASASESKDEESLQISELFSPIKIIESPVLHKQGNLTGSARKLKDGAADLHNLMQKWRVLNADGTNVLTEIANIKLECILAQDGETAVNQLPESLLPLCDRLGEVLQRMEKIVTKLTGLAAMSKGVTRLEQYSNPDQEDIIIFQTWNLQRFESVFSRLGDMHHKELKLKQCIAENVCHAKDRNTVMFYSAAWLHQPYIDCDAKLMLESMLLETKHKT